MIENAYNTIAIAPVLQIMFVCIIIHPSFFSVNTSILDINMFSYVNDFFASELVGCHDLLILLPSHQHNMTSYEEWYWQGMFNIKLINDEF